MSIAQSLLAPPPVDLQTHAPGKRRDGSSRSSLRAPAAGGPPSLHLIIDSPIQSNVPILCSLCSTRDPVVLVALARDAEVYTPNDVSVHDSISVPLWGNPYTTSTLPGPRTIDSLLTRIKSGLQRVRQAKPGARTTIIFNSLHPILDTPAQGLSGAIALVRGTLALLQAPMTNSLTGNAQSSEGRLVIGLTPDADLTPRTSKFVAQLQSASLWSASSPAAGDATRSTSGQGGSTSVSYLLPAPFAKVIQDDYAQRLPLTPTPPKSSQGTPAETSDPAEARVWPLLHALTSRGTLGRSDQPGWWLSAPTHTRPILESIRPPSATSSASSDSGSKSNVVGLLVSYSRSSQGKVNEEVVGLSFNATQELTVVPLTPEVVDKLQPPAIGSNVSATTPVVTQAPTGSAGGTDSQEGDPHAALLAGLPFNLTETSAQRAQRAQVKLPHQVAQQAAQGAVEPSTQGRGSIVFHPEAVDDADEEELDEEDEEI